MKAPKTETLTSEKTEFRREITTWGAISIMGGIMIGSGIFYIGSYALMRSGMSQGLALVAWLIGGLVSLLGAICYAELGTMMPKAGGAQIYLNAAYHPCVGYAKAFSAFAIGGPASIAALAIALPTACRSFIDISDTGVKVAGVVLIIGFTAINYFGIKLGDKVQKYTMVAKLIPIILILIAGIFLGKVTPNLSMVPQDGTPVTFSNMVSMIAFSVVATLWAYDGWANVSAVGEEIKDPHKNLPRALMAGVGMVTAIYVLFNFSIFRVLEPGKISSLVESGDYYLGTAAAKQTLGYVGGVAVLLAMIFSMLSSMNGMIITYPRMTYAIAEDGHFFSLFGKLHPTHKVPGNALIVQAIISCIFVIFRSLSSLTTLVTFSGLLWNFLVAVGVIVLRYRMPNAERPYKIRLYPYLVIVASLAFFGLIVNQIITKPETVSIGLIVPVVAVLVYFIFDQRLKKTVQ